MSRGNFLLGEGGLGAGGSCCGLVMLCVGGAGVGGVSPGRATAGGKMFQWNWLYGCVVLHSGQRWVRWQPPGQLLFMW